jgi:hypothetical protein
MMLVTALLMGSSYPFAKDVLAVMSPLLYSASRYLVASLFLFIALAATLAGARACTEVEFFALGREDLLRQFLTLKHGVPSHDTFTNVFRGLDPNGLEAVLRKFSKSFGIKGMVSIDGNALRGATTAADRLCRCTWSMSGRQALV